MEASPGDSAELSPTVSSSPGKLPLLMVPTSLLAMVEKAGFELVDYRPYGAFPAFFYFFAGIAFTLLRGKGLNLSRAIYPYFLGQILFAPVLLLEKQLNFAMQTVVCRRKA